MGFLKKFFHAPTPGILEVAPRPEITQPERATVSLHKTPLPQETQHIPAAVKPDERISAIEAHALSLGWTWDQLWQKSKRPDRKGLAALIKTSQIISTVTPQYIQLESVNPTGKLEIQRFYNHPRDQPWLKQPHCDQILRTALGE